VLDQTGELTAYGNPLGLQLPKERDNLRSRLDRMEAQLVAQNEEIAANKKEIGTHKEKFAELEKGIAAQEEEIAHLKFENMIFQERAGQFERRVQFLCMNSKEYIQTRHEFLDSCKERIEGRN
jgi:chromosome segregation ATPase